MFVVDMIHVLGFKPVLYTYQYAHGTNGPTDRPSPGCDDAYRLRRRTNTRRGTNAPVRSTAVLAHPSVLAYRELRKFFNERGPLEHSAYGRARGLSVENLLVGHAALTDDRLFTLGVPK